MGSWFGCAPAVTENTGPAVFEQELKNTVSIFDPVEAVQIGKIEEIKRTTIYNGQSEPANNLRNLGHREVKN